MFKDNHHVVQAEFFHGNTDEGDYLDHALDHAWMRLLGAGLNAASGTPDLGPGSGIKTCVRFYDRTGDVSRLVRHAHRMREKHKGVMQKLASSRGIGRFILLRREKRLRAAQGHAEKLAFKFAFKEFERSAHFRRPLALETVGHRYRSLSPDEARSFSRSLRHARSMWLFLFKPNDLLADDIACVASISL